MSSVRKVGKKWYARFIDENGKAREKAGFTDKRETERLAVELEARAAKIREGLVDPRELVQRDHAKTPLSDHISAWEGSLRSAGGTGRHVSMSVARVRRLMAIVMGATAAETEYPRAATKADRKAREERLARWLAPARLGDLTAERVQKALGELRDSGMSLQSLNHHRAAARSFDIWCHETGRTRETALRSVKGFNAKEDPRHERRTISLEELQRLVEAAHRGPAVMGVSGPIRSLSYRLAVASGLRYNELRSIRPESFDWAVSPATVRVKPAYEKNRQGAVIPIADELAADLKPLVNSVPQGEAVFPLPADKGAEMLRFDLEAAEIPYRDQAGRVFDFHSTRCQTATLLDQAGVSPRVAQRVMRHSTPGLTDRYTRPRAIDIERAALAIPPLRPEGNKPEAPSLAKTGTEGFTGHAPTPIRVNLPAEGEKLAHYLPIAGDVLSRAESPSDVMALSDKQPAIKRLEAEKTGFDASRRSKAGGNLNDRAGTRTQDQRINLPHRLSPTTDPVEGGSA